ncbi:MAG: hypothetical protein ACYDHH_29065 [Solirubrobacteraceae bacterium]
MGKQSRAKRERRAAPPPPVGKKRRNPWAPHRLTLVVTAALAAVLAVGLAVAFGHSGSTALKLGPPLANQNALPGLQTGQPPWPAEHGHLGARLDTLGLPRLQMEGNVIHIHQHLDLYVNGHHLTVPALIGIDARQRYLDPLHTHDPSGIIHIESPTKTDYTLGQFFAVWGVRLTRICIGGLCSGTDKELRAWVNGKPVNGDPSRILLQAHQEIVLAYGTSSQVPSTIPSRYAFPAGL